MESTHKRRASKESPRLNFELLESRSMLSVADLSGFAGVGNTSSPNNYTSGVTTAGGTFDTRRFAAAGESAAYLADTVLNVSGGALTRTTAGGFGANGTLTFDASANATVTDPVFYFGFFDNESLTAGAFGFSIANQTATSFRFRASAGTAQTSGSGTVVADGTYTFDLDVNNAQSGANLVRFRLINAALSTVADVSVAISAGLTLSADSFGFLQPLAASGSNDTFSLSVSDINYTGETQVTVTPTLPAAPTNLNATPLPGQINLVWQDNSNNETGFTIERRVGAGDFAPLATVVAGAANYQDNGLAELTTYTYRVRAYNGVGASAWSNENSATTPVAPSVVTVTASNYSRTAIYSGTQATGYLPGDPSWTSWVGAWIMPNGDLMVGVTQASGRLQPFHASRNYSQLDIDVVYLRGVRATDGSGNVTWTKVVESDVSFTTAADSGLGTHANNSPTTIALTDGSLIRRVYGWDYGAFPNMPGTSFIQRSIDGGLTWSAAPTSSDGGVTWSNTDPRMAGRQQFLLDPNTTTVQMTRTLRLSDGRLLMGGAVWNGRNAQTGPNAPLLMVSGDEGVSWQQVTFSGPAYNPSKYNEWDIAELDNGDLFILSRPVSNDSRWQTIMTKSDNTWQLQTLTQVPVDVLPHSGHPELLKTQEGPILQFATTGTRWTNDFGATWNVLSGGTVNSRYYPHSLQTADGWIYVFGHVGSDNAYGQVAQRVDMDKFRITVTGIPQPVVGDYNGDFEVDAGDLTVWRETFAQPPVGTINADGDDDGDIDGNDFLVWQRNLQPAAVTASAPAAGGASVEISVAAEAPEASDAAFAQLAGEGLPLRQSDQSATRRSFDPRRPAADASVVNQSAHNRPLQLAPPRREIISGGGAAFAKAIDVVLENDPEGLKWRANAFKSLSEN